MSCLAFMPNLEGVIAFYTKIKLSDLIELGTCFGSYKPFWGTTSVCSTSKFSDENPLNFWSGPNHSQPFLNQRWPIPCTHSLLFLDVFLKI